MNSTKLIAELRTGEQEHLDGAARARMRATIMDSFRRVMADAGADVPASGERYRSLLIYGPAFAAIILALGIATTVAAEGSKPGDPLYRWERGVEKVRVGLTIFPEAHARLEADLAEERTEELEAAWRDDPAKLPVFEKETNDAVEHALILVTRVEEQEREKGNEKKSESLKKVKNRLESLKAKEETHDAAEEEDAAPPDVSEDDTGLDQDDKKSDDDQSRTDENSEGGDEQDNEKVNRGEQGDEER